MVKVILIFSASRRLVLSFLFHFDRISMHAHILVQFNTGDDDDDEQKKKQQDEKEEHLSRPEPNYFWKTACARSLAVTNRTLSFIQSTTKTKQEMEKSKEGKTKNSNEEKNFARRERIDCADHNANNGTKKNKKKKKNENVFA